MVQRLHIPLFFAAAARAHRVRSSFVSQLFIQQTGQYTCGVEGLVTYGISSSWICKGRTRITKQENAMAVPSAYLITGMR